MRLERPRLGRIGVREGHVVGRDAPNEASFDKSHRTEFGAANSRCVLQHLLEHRLQVAGRGTDDLEDF